jgi:uncharacterized protein YcbK (DUF882 family)
MDELLRTDCSRRSFLRTSFAAAVVCCTRSLWPTNAFAGRLPEGRLVLCHAHTNERLEVTYRNDFGQYDTSALEDLNNFMRCNYTSRTASMDLRVIEFLNTLHKQVGHKEVIVHSAYRSPEYQTVLIKQRGRRVARQSFHVTAQAVDFHIPGVPLRQIRQAALQLGQGGVGYYPRRGFVHVDCGPVRWW